ncbi:hypothetical protein DEIPH_ctg025orf0018 [Deinococcus phoenicis]|uniref:Lipoprotein n=1 Tax=Deinococcus phoenicis TaxID=1476583 RepID=A0A016QQC4_9DEIO|nr:hypothetical protein [Deinococcus phoenicis]EYB68186.1 hypothetical protein DEIPH_ctg025orf0018 [Deinococcus phoenicis]
MKNFRLLLLAGSALLLASCNTDKVPGYGLSGTVVEGTYDSSGILTTTPWKGGVGSVVASIPTQDGRDLTELARTTLAADGKFNLSLPRPANNQLGPVDGEDVAGSGAHCQGTIEISDRQAQGTGLFLSVDAKDASKDGLLALVAGSTVMTGDKVVIDQVSGGLMYVDRDVKIKGVRTCIVSLKEGTATTTNDVNLTLQKGWNKFTTALKIEADGTRSQGTITLRSGSFPTDNWVFMSPGIAQPLGLQSLKTFNIPFFR